MRVVILLLCLITSWVYADYKPASVFPKVRNAKTTVSFSNGQFVYTPDCAPTDVVVQPTEANPSNLYCHTCPTTHPEIDYVYVEDSGFDFQRPICQRPCKENEKRFSRFGGAGYVCMTCNEVWKEWRDDKCEPKICPEPLVLDTSTGACKEYDVTCPSGKEKVYSFSTKRPYCTDYCAAGQYRDKQGFCIKIPECLSNQTLVMTQEFVKTTAYNEYECKALCSPDENEINGQCYQRCELNEIFEDGQCVSADGIIRAINRLKNRFLDISYNATDNLYEKSDYTIEQLQNANDELDNYQPPKDNSNNQYDLSKLDSDTPFFNIDTLLDDSIFASRHQCPSDRTLEIMSSTYEFQFSRICGFLQLLSNLVMAISIVLSYFIIRGR